MKETKTKKPENAGTKTQTEKKEFTAKERKEILKQAEKLKKPVKMDFKMSAGELDVRCLTPLQMRQVKFRMDCQNAQLLKTVHEDLVDVMRLEMVILNQLGVKNIPEAINKICLDQQSIIEKEYLKEKEN